MNFKALQKKAKLRLLQMHYESGVGHIGGNISALDSMLYLHHKIMDKDDNFILSKGHAAGALYITLWSTGKISDADLKTFHKDHTKLAGHPAPNWIKDIPFATGSLGHGLGLAAGMAIGNKLQKRKGRVFCMMSDGEWQEGSNWEALIFLCHHKLENLTILVDCNGIQGFGSTAEIASMDINVMYAEFSVFDVNVKIINGHSEKEIAESLRSNNNRPTIILMNTHKGNGISFMEDKMEWHYLPLTEELYNKAITEVEAL